jgi:transcriptional regulator with XRE-family HTH domain
MTGEDMRRLRREAGLTQRELAEAMGVWLNTISRWEIEKRHISEPHARLIQLICQNSKKSS